jgi:hypothetical protein
MIAPRSPDARSPRPRGPAAFSPTSGSSRRAALTAADMRSSCQRTSSVTACARSGAARPAAFAAYAAAPRAWAPHMRDGCGLPGRSSCRRGCRSAYLGRRDATCEAAANSLCDVKLVACERPRPGNQITRTAIPGAAASKIGNTRSAQSAAHAATARRSASLSVCGDRTPKSFQPRAAIMGTRLTAAPRRRTFEREARPIMLVTCSTPRHRADAR